MKKLLIVLLVAALSISAAQAAGSPRAWGKDHGTGNPHLIICQIFSDFDWKWCRGDWTND
jgi:hypothetical protein